MFNIVLVHPEIPPNTGNVIRLAANTGLGPWAWLFLVLAAGARMLAQQLHSHRLNLQDSHLNHDLRNAVDLMTRELHRGQKTPGRDQCQGARQ